MLTETNGGKLGTKQTKMTFKDIFAVLMKIKRNWKNDSDQKSLVLKLSLKLLYKLMYRALDL